MRNETAPSHTELMTRNTLIRNGTLPTHQETIEQYAIRCEHWQKLLNIGFWSELPISEPQEVPFGMPITQGLKIKGCFEI